MPTVDQKPVVKSSNSKRGSLTSDKTKKAKKKKKSKKSAKLESKEGLILKDVNSLEIEGTRYQNDVLDIDDTDDSSSTKTLLPKLSVSDITVKCKTTPRPVSTDSQSTRLSNPRQTDKKTAVPRSKPQSADSFSAKLSNISLKNKNSKSKNKTGSGSAGKKDSGSAKTKKTPDEKQTPALNSVVKPNIVETQKNVPIVSESVRWENELTSTDMERERIHLYKINRRKRYLAAAQLKGLGWVKQYGVNGFPLSEDASVDIRKDGGINEFSTVSIIRTSQNLSLLGDAKAISIGH